MSSFFIWGCCFGFLSRAAAARAAGQAFTTSYFIYFNFLILFFSLNNRNLVLPQIYACLRSHFFLLGINKKKQKKYLTSKT